ncbi:hypothetical protein RCO48_17785 [Peribacillus frigoritolerans]|nr:hypothetical protein [Peribacillus frigoritolerans]
MSMKSLFYFIDKEFQYALYAPDKEKRWELKEYAPTEADLAFAKRFIEWNNLEWGIQRVDACRNEQGELLLVELEDLNPYLSLLELTEETRQNFCKSHEKNQSRKHSKLRMKTAVSLASQDPTGAWGFCRQSAERERVSENSWNILQIKKTAGKLVFLRVCLQSEMTTESQGTINSFEIYAISTHFQ